MPSREERRRPFRLNRLTALTLLFSTLVTATTGVVLFLSPPFSAAGRLHWKFLGLTKGQHDDLHVISAGLCLVAGAVHIILHFKSLLHYMRRRIRPLLVPSFEMLVAACLLAILIWATLANWAPIMAFLDFGENFRNSIGVPRK